LLQGWLRVERHPRFEIHLYLRPAQTEVFQRGRQPLNTAVALNGDPQRRLLRFIAGLQRAANLRQDLICQLQQNFALRGEAKRLTLTDK